MKVALATSIVLNLFLAGFAVWAMLYSDSLHRKLVSEKRDLFEEIRLQVVEDHQAELDRVKTQLERSHAKELAQLRQEVRQQPVALAETAPPSSAPQTLSGLAWDVPVGGDTEVWRSALMHYQPFMHVYNPIKGGRSIRAFLVFYESRDDGSQPNRPRLLTLSYYVVNDVWEPARSVLILSERAWYFRNPTLTIRLDRGQRIAIKTDWSTDFLNGDISLDLLRQMASAQLIEIDWEGGYRGRLHPRSQNDIQTFLRAVTARTEADAARVIPLDDPR